MKKYIVTLIGLVIVLVMMGQTKAAVTVFSNEVDYDAATGPQIFLINFDGNPPGGTYADGASFSSAITFGSPEASDPTKVWWNSDAITDAGSTTAPNYVGPMDGVFTDPVYAFALVFLSAGEAETIYLYDESNNLLGTVTAPNPSGFFGVLSDTPIKKFVIDNGVFPNGWPDRFFIDDFRANEPLIEVSIDIKPGSYPNSINLKSKGVVAVAVLTTVDFDASTVDPATVEFAGATPLRWTLEDVDNDGDLDMLFHFDTQTLQLNENSTEATLTGETVGGQEFTGTDTVRIVPPKK